MSDPRQGAAVAPGLLSLDAVLDHVAAARRSGRTVGFTNGCFDVLHAGHRHLLSSAAREADHLIVALNSDASVRRLKGADRPAEPLDRRAAAVAAVEGVDWVCAFDEDTPLSTIGAIVPDVLIKGDDWAADAIVGREQVESSGGRVVRVRRLRGLSTTAWLRGTPAP